MPRKYKNFSPEFRNEAARMVVETSRPIADVARELGVSETSLGNWVRAYRPSIRLVHSKHATSCRTGRSGRSVSEGGRHLSASAGPPIRSGIEKRLGVAGASLSTVGRK